MVTDWGNNLVRRVKRPLTGFTGNDLIIPSEDGKLVYRFDSKGRHLSTLNALTSGVLFDFAYTNGLLTQITDGDGKVTEIKHDGAGNPVELVGPFNQKTTFGVDSNGYLATVTNPKSEIAQFTYSSSGLLKTFVDPRGNSYTFDYDEVGDNFGHLTSDADPEGGLQTLSREEIANGYEVTRTTKASATSNYSASYRVEKLANGDKNRVDTSPDGTQKGLLIKPSGLRQTTFADGTVDGLQQASDPRFGLQVPLPASRTVTVPNPSLSSTTTTLRTVALSDPNDPLSVTRLTDEVRVNGRLFINDFDGPTRTFTSTTPASRRTTSVINSLGRPISAQVFGLEPLAFAYNTTNAPGHLETVTQGTGANARTFTLDYYSDASPREGLLRTLTDPLNRVFTFDYDAAGRVTKETFPDNRFVTFSYDENGNVTSVSPPRAPSPETLHTFAYSKVDLGSKYTPPLAANTGSLFTRYDYTLDRQLDLVTRPDGATIDYIYGATTGRLDSMVTPRGTTTSTYKSTPNTGQLETISTPEGNTLTFGYDGFLLLSETWGGTVLGSVSRTFNNNFWAVEEKVNGANAIAFTYDNDGLLTGAGAEFLTPHAQHGLISNTTLGVVTDELTYNGFGELATYVAKVSGSPIHSVVYDDGGSNGERDKLGRIVKKTETVSNVTSVWEYLYDPSAGWLMEVKKDGATVATYTYDSNGNRETYSGPLGTVTDADTWYDDQDRLTTYADKSFTYSANGELASKTDASGTTSYTYDVLGNLTAVTLPDSTQIDYVIDGRNRRIGKRVNGTLVQGFLYADQLRPVAELDGSGAIVARFVYASKANIPDYVTKGANTYSVVSDHLGSPRLVIDTSTGTVVQQIDYDEFGNVLSDSNPGFQPFGFAGGLYDQHTKLTRFGARDYAADVGRWTARDPVLFDGGDSNLYAYSLSDPVNLVDPEGLEFAEAWGAYGAMIGGSIVAGGSMVADAATGGINILATPAEIGAGAALGGAIGYGVGSAADYIASLRDLYAKGRKQNIRDTGLENLSDDEVSIRARDRSLSPAERKRYQKEEKARKRRHSSQSKCE